MKNDNIIIKRVIQRCGCDMVLPLTLVYVFYIILHGHLSPGGGFQGGVLMTAVIILMYLGHGYEATCNALNIEFLRRTEGLPSRCISPLQCWALCSAHSSARISRITTAASAT